MKKTLVLVLALLMLFANTAMAAVGPVKESTRAKNVDLKTSFSKDDTAKYDADEKVRVIVEVEGAPAIEYATKQGKKFSELSESKKAELHNQALSVQNAVKSKLTSKKVNMEFKENFTTAFNGFSGIVEYGKIATIEKLDGVVNVTITNEYKRPTEKPEMKYSKELVEAQRAWDEYGYNGEGMIVGVIDSGIDPSHKDMILTDGTKAALSKEEVEAKVADNNLPGKFYTGKVPYGYNYMDKNSEIRDLGPGASMHGMHVSGTVGANGDEDNGGIKGVAPEAQILGLKVFGNDPEMGSTWGDIYIKAIDDAIILGVDVINMSLGSTASFVNADDPEQQAIARAVENGVVMSISAGNSAHLGNGYYNPYASNPDIGVVGSPGLSYDSIQVASLDNAYMDMDAVTVSIDGEEAGLLTFMSAGNVHPNDVDTKTFEIVAAGLGGPTDFDGIDVAGKYVLIQRGEHSFVDKALNAQNAGAAGVIIYNNTTGYVSMATDNAIVIPQLFMLMNDGDTLKEQLDAGAKVTVSFEGEKKTAQNPTGGKMSDFTSWGVTPNLDFKPEITAPGGNILSTFNDDQYGTMSGTSMASPHVAGGSALVLQRVQEEFAELEGKAKVEMAKKILMNTAKPVRDQGTINTMFEFDNPYSPRRQGAGLMQLHAALSTPVVVTEKEKGEAKVALKEVGDKFNFTLEAKNYSDEAVTYDVAANVQTDLSLFGLLGYAANELEAQELVDAKVTLNGGKSTVKVPANSTATIKVEIDLSQAKVLNENASDYVKPEEIFPNGYFVEGFVTLTDKSDVNPKLSVPYVGFKGDWNAAPVLDELAYDDHNSFYEQAGMLYTGSDGYYYLGYNPITEENEKARIAISPNGDGVQDDAFPILSFLRNAKLVEYSILDSDKKELRKLRSETNVRKNYFDGGLGLPYTFNSANAWDGKVNKEMVADGKYYYQVATTIDFPGKEAQKLQIPVVVDTVAPTVTGSIEEDVVKINANDELSGVNYIEVLIDGDSLGIVSANTKEFELEEAVTSDSELVLLAVDNAGNETEFSSNVAKDKTAPVIEVKTPETFSIHNTDQVTVAGFVKDESAISKFTVQGKDVALEKVSEGEYSFTTTITLPDGANEIAVVAKDSNGNETNLSNSRMIFVDTSAPVIDVDVPVFVDHNVKSVDLTATLKDNAEELRYFVNENEEFYQELPGYDMKPFSKVVTTKVALKPGNNVFELKLVDLAGNTTEKTVEVYRNESESRVDRLSGTTRYSTSVEISKAGWEKSETVVLARGDNFADAITGAPLAKKFDAPLLLTKPTAVSSDVMAEIERLGAKTVYVLGGEAAISSDVVKQLENKGIKVNRVSGKNRYETSVAVAHLVAPNGANEAVVANGQNFPDALAVSAYAANNGIPVLLTGNKELHDATAKALDKLGVTKTVVVGGKAVVSNDVLVELPRPTRLSGKTRYETALAIAEYFEVDGFHYYVATGTDFADALSGAALAAKNNAGIVLVGNKVDKGVANFLNENAKTATLIGGTNAISNSVLDQINKLLK
ncbi:cell wall-binding repeat-containing protein [Bacillus timonensis]|uniref:cell wall-binding repeat-containing protein n=1 Tax=Bacillus timonensis TaxID=1033734 RepID=UPI0002885C24|nr:cell wall-binding repeat-containing protein [Bacillus timonensis]